MGLAGVPSVPSAGSLWPQFGVPPVASTRSNVGWPCWPPPTARYACTQDRVPKAQGPPRPWHRAAIVGPRMAGTASPWPRMGSPVSPVQGPQYPQLRVSTAPAQGGHRGSPHGGHGVPTAQHRVCVAGPPISGMSPMSPRSPCGAATMGPQHPRGPGTGSRTSPARGPHGPGTGRPRWVPAQLVQVSPGSHHGDPSTSPAWHPQCPQPGVPSVPSTVSPVSHRRASTLGAQCPQPRVPHCPWGGQLKAQVPPPPPQNAQRRCPPWREGPRPLPLGSTSAPQRAGPVGIVGGAAPLRAAGNEARRL